MKRERNRRRTVDNGQTRTALLVVGMHRSGTSALARVISLLGATLPKRLIGEGVGNPTGHWESEQATRIHEAIFAAFGSSHYDPTSFPHDWFGTPAALPFENDAVAVLADEFHNASTFVLKDPRLCIFVPLWYQALARFGAVTKTALIYRHPLEVSASLEVRNGWPKHQNLILWLKYVLDGELHTRAQARTVVTYEGLMADWRSTTDRMLAELDTPGLQRSPDIDRQIDAFLSPDLKHHTHAADDLQADAAVCNWVRDTYDALGRLHAGDTTATETLDRVRQEWLEAECAYRPFITQDNPAVQAMPMKAQEFETLRTENAQLRVALMERAIEISKLRLDSERRAVELGRLGAELARVHGR